MTGNEATAREVVKDLLATAENLAKFETYPASELNSVRQRLSYYLHNPCERAERIAARAAIDLIDIQQKIKVN